MQQMTAFPVPVAQYVEVNGFRINCPVRKLPSRKQSNSKMTGSSDDQAIREKKSAVYETAAYDILLEEKGGFMRGSERGRRPISDSKTEHATSQSEFQSAHRPAVQTCP